MPPDGRTRRGRESRKEHGGGFQKRDPFSMAVRRALEDEELHQVHLAAALGVSEATASRAMNGQRAWSLEDAVAVTDLLGGRPLSLLLERVGYEVVPLEDAADSHGAIIDGFNLAGAVGRVQAGLAEAIEDGRIDRMEATELRREVRQVLDATRTMLVALDALAGGE